jgi:hypothetical protein
MPYQTTQTIQNNPAQQHNTTMRGNKQSSRTELIMLSEPLEDTPDETSSYDLYVVAAINLSYVSRWIYDLYLDFACVIS